MLSELRIKNFAIIESLDFSFHQGMNILTGETGAGKSIIIQAVNLILGDRASSGLVRSGEKEASVEALFSIAENKGIREKLASLAIEADEELIIRRVISQEGKNRVFVNGTLATLSVLSDIAENLISISSQHEHQSLLKSDNHLYFLDSCGKLESAREEYQQAYRGWQKLAKRVKNIEATKKSNHERAALLTFQLGEIVQANIEPDEDIHLKEERTVLINAEKLVSCAAMGDDVIYGCETSIISGLSNVINEVKECATLDGKLKETSESLENILFQLEDTALSLREYGGMLTVDPARLTVVEERILFIEKLLEKYGSTTEDLLLNVRKMEVELNSIQEEEISINDIEKSLKIAKDISLKLAEKLSLARKNAALQLSKEMKVELEDLGMKDTLFDVRLKPLSEKCDGVDEKLSENGLEEVEFYLATNPGEEPKPLAKIASGGELSRIMLALKGSILGEEKMATLVFDEVDSGIGGGIAEVVGRKMKNVSKDAHVICITHLPQIAAIGDVHFKVTKNVKDGRTFTSIEKLDDRQRVEEVARMLGGLHITEKTMEHASEILKNA